ncbi:unnamed protein product [Polarella glacialis]|uniref:Pseudouridine synthase RsuA/RluA-like domain-containing protein n=1 Tax=Polarella glacialis TaxID=89957 RepID=A0A813LZG4_POLGL|nr:unnamed protein product [Polarella glacialis]
MSPYLPLSSPLGEVPFDGRLSEYLGAMLSSRLWPISSESAYQNGFLHRLDVPSSGILLMAKTYEAYYDLQLQLHSGGMTRDYIVLCHGWLYPWQREVKERVHWLRDSKRGSTVEGRGKPSQTKLKVLRHATRSGQALSIVAVRIVTGRMHQIRLHTAHIGHPTVCDGRYSSAVTFQADRQWCGRNFLHRHRLAFLDHDGHQREALDPLPADLQHVLALLGSGAELPAFPPGAAGALAELGALPNELRRNSSSKFASA